jgi:hypothetical protein
MGAAGPPSGILFTWARRSAPSRACSPRSWARRTLLQVGYRYGRGAQCAFLRDLAALCALNVIGSNGNLSGGDKPLEQSCEIAPDHMGRSAILTPNRYFWPKSSRTSGPAHQVVGEKAKLLRHLQTFENSILIRVHVQSLRSAELRLDVFSYRPAGEDRGGDPRSSKLVNPASTPMGRPAVRTAATSATGS